MSHRHNSVIPVFQGLSETDLQVLGCLQVILPSWSLQTSRGPGDRGQVGLCSLQEGMVQKGSINVKLGDITLDSFVMAPKIKPFEGQNAV